MKNIKACVFNAYGTLLDSYLPFDEYGEQLGENALVIYKLWRQKRLQYSSQLSLMNRYTSYEKIQKYALDFACETYGMHDEKIKANILASHSDLNCYADVKEMLEKLKKNDIKLAVLSNGAPRGLNKALKSAQIDGYLDRVFTTGEIKAYKPSPAVYEYVREELALPSNKICFVSTNSWDIAGAVSYGYYSVWINRNKRVAEQLPYKADLELKSLSALQSSLSLTK